MKKLAIALFIVAASVVTIKLAPEPTPTGKYPAHFLAKSVSIQFAQPAQAASPIRGFEYLLSAITTTTNTRSGKTAILTSTTGTESAPTATNVGLDLWNVSAVSVILKTSASASTGTLQCYLMNAETGTWARAAAYDLTATATTDQTWTMVNIPVSVGRIYYNPVGIGSVQTTIYLVGGR